MRRARHLFTLVLPLIVACGGGDTTQPTPPPAPPPPAPPPPPPPPPAPAPVASVVVSPTTFTLVPQQTAQLTAETRDSSGNVLSGRAVSWTTDTAGVLKASVNATGVVTALTPGTSVVTATSEGRSGTSTITIAEGGFIVPAGAAFTAAGGRVRVVAPAGAVAVGAAVTVTPLANPPAHPDLIDGTAWQLDPDSTTLAQPVTIHLTWLPEQLASDAVKEQIRVHRFDGSAWVPLTDALADTAARESNGTTTSFGTFALIELPSNPVPVISAISPTTVDAGTPAFTLTVSGTGFVDSSVVRWNGAARPTTFQSASSLTAQITAADVASAGDAAVTVFSPAPRGGTTTALTFTILTPPPPPPPPPPPQATFVVTSTANSGAGSLRQAIINANTTSGNDSIHFNIPGAGPHTIRLTTALPSITEAVVIDGYTQPGALPNTNPSGAINAVLKIELDGVSLPGGAHGLTIAGEGSTVRGLVINRSGGDGIHLVGGGNNVIEGNFLGTNATGSFARANSGSGLRTINSKNNLIGGSTPAARNVISGGNFHGVDLGGSASTGNRIEGNLIGLNAAATTGLGGVFGVFLEEGASDNVIGGTAPGTGNVISGNGSHGIVLRRASRNRIQGNHIGTNPTGSAPIRNGATGISIEVDAAANVIGGSSPAHRNVISGNEDNGIRVRASGSMNRIEGNFIGVDATGTTGVGNGEDGIRIENTAGTIIGGTAPGSGNIVSMNGDDGIDFSGAQGTVVQGNVIGSDATGTINLGNGDAGMNIFNSGGNSIGGTQSGAGNVIAFNKNVRDRAGIRIAGTSTQNAMLGNAIYANLGFGIDLMPGGITANDLGDSDTGPNNLQNFPVLTAATLRSSLSVTGTFNSVASTTFRIEFFANDTLDPSGHGEGQRYLGFAEIATDANGNALIDVDLSAAGISAGQFITATATDADGNTSEFSAGVVVQQGNG